MSDATLGKRKRGQGKRKDRDQATMAAFEATRFFTVSGLGLEGTAPPPSDAEDWRAVVTCTNMDLTQCRQLRLPLAHRQDVDDNGTGLLFALSLSHTALQSPGCAGPVFDCTSLASASLVQQLAEGQRKASAEAAVQGAPPSLANVCAADLRPTSVSVQRNQLAVCSFKLPLQEPLEDLNGDFWCLQLTSNKQTAVMRLLISKRHRTPHAVEYFCIQREMERLCAAQETPI